MGVDEAGQHDPAGEVDGLGTGRGQRQHLVGGADGDDAPAARQQALRQRPVVVLGVDPPAEEGKVAHGAKTYRTVDRGPWRRRALGVTRLG